MKSMLKYYYIFWVDAVTFVRRKEKNEKIIFLPLAYVTAAMGINLFVLSIFLLDFWGLKINLLALGNYLLSLVGIDNGKLGSGLTTLMIFLFNYLTVFRNNKIERLIKKYPNYNGKIFISYFLCSVLIPIFVLVVSFVYVRYLQ